MTHYRILLVEDNPDIRDKVKQVLESRGHDVVAVNTAEQGYVAHGSMGFDVLMTDSQLPDMTGVDLIKRIRAIDDRIGIVVCTEAPKNGIEEELDDELRVLGVLETPCSADEVMDKVYDAVSFASIEPSKQTYLMDGLSAETNKISQIRKRG